SAITTRINRTVPLPKAMANDLDDSIPIRALSPNSGRAINGGLLISGSLRNREQAYGWRNDLERSISERQLAQRQLVSAALKTAETPPVKLPITCPPRLYRGRAVFGMC